MARPHPLARLRASRGRTAAATIAASVTVLAISACGSSSATPTDHEPALTGSSVAVVQTNVTAQMVPAATHPSATTREAEFTLTATDRAGRPAADQPVRFWIGPMFPHCDDPIKAWYEVGGRYARRFVASDSTRTNAQGRATLTLLGQTPRTMEMVALRVGNLSSFDDGHGVGVLDAWWTSPGASPTAPIGDRVTVAPFLTARDTARDAFRVRVTDAGDHAVGGARVSLRANVMSVAGHASTSGSSAIQRTTNSTGETTFDYPKRASGTLRVKVYTPSAGQLFSGAMTAETVSVG